MELDHVAIGCHRLDDASALAVGLLGGRPHEGGPGLGFRWAQWRYANGGVLEFLEPDGPPGGFLHRFLESRGPGIHHVTFKVKGIEERIAHAERLGYGVVGFDDRNPGWKECFLHPKQAQGIVVQLAESIPELDEYVDARFAFPEHDAPAPDPADIVRLRLCAHDGDAVRRQWSDVLGGTLDESDGELHFRWPGSAIAISVAVDPDTPEGPRQIEVAANRPLALPDGAYPFLGTIFVQTNG